MDGLSRTARQSAGIKQADDFFYVESYGYSHHTLLSSLLSAQHDTSLVFFMKIFTWEITDVHVFMFFYFLLLKSFVLVCWQSETKLYNGSDKDVSASGGKLTKKESLKVRELKSA